MRGSVGHPHVSLLVDKNSVRERYLAFAEALDELAVERDLDHRVEVGIGAAIGAAAVENPQMLAIGSHLESAGHPDLSALEFVPVVIDLVRIVRSLSL